jgi:glucose/arabinose dehydrogenase
MRNLILSGVAAIALATVPALAQETDNDANASAQADQAAPQPQSADQANAEAAPAPATTTVVPEAASGAGAVVTTFPGNVTAPPPAARDYPVCTRKLQDECQNPGEGGAPGRSRALKYWPGKPASEGGH